MMRFLASSLFLLAFAARTLRFVEGLAQPVSRRAALLQAGACGWLSSYSSSSSSFADDAQFDVDDFLRTGLVAQPMGVSGQAGKSKPETGVLLRDGSEVARNDRSGNVLAEILVKNTENKGLMPVIATFSSPWPLATGTVYDVECRSAETGDGAFLAVSSDLGGKRLDDLNKSFLVKSLFSPTGRFSFYGQPTDIKVKEGGVVGDYKWFDVSFSTLSQSTQTEIPRKATVVATIPNGSTQAVMLVGSASALRWKKGSDKVVASTIGSFQAVAAPQTSLTVRAKSRTTS